MAYHGGCFIAPPASRIYSSREFDVGGPCGPPARRTCAAWIGSWKHTASVPEAIGPELQFFLKRLRGAYSATCIFVVQALVV